MIAALNTLMGLLLEDDHREIVRIELDAAGMRALSTAADGIRTFRYDGVLHHRGYRVEAGDRARVIARVRGELLAFPLPERVAL